MACLLRLLPSHRESHDRVATPSVSNITIEVDRPSPNLTLEPGRHQDGDFWDSLSRVHLTSRALRELDRRNRVLQRKAMAQPDSSISSTWLQNLVTNGLLRRFARSGGPDLSDLRGFPVVTPISHKAPSTCSFPLLTDTSTSKRSSPYSANFRQKLIDIDVFPYKDHEKIENWDEVQRRLAQPRPSLTSSQFGDDRFAEFQEACDSDSAESGVVQNAIMPFIARSGQSSYLSRTNTSFNNLQPFDQSLSAPTPDLYDGVSPKSIPLQIRHDLESLIIPSTDTSRPAAPNFFSEWKSERGRADVAKLQACYDGAVGARAIHALQNYGETEPRYDNKANSISATYYDGTLKLYAMYTRPPAGEEIRPSYHMTQLCSFAMTNNSKTFREGAAAYRNARDYAAEIREASVREAANKVNTTLSHHGAR